MSRHKAYPPHVGTIGGVIRIGHGLHLYRLNRECQRRATIAMVKQPAHLVRRARRSECFPLAGYQRCDVAGQCAESVTGRCALGVRLATRRCRGRRRRLGV